MLVLNKIYYGKVVHNQIKGGASSARPDLHAQYTAPMCLNPAATGSAASAAQMQQYWNYYQVKPSNKS